jgi:hypothetical protein
LISPSDGSKSSFVFSGAFTAEEGYGAGEKGSGETTILM